MLLRIELGCKSWVRFKAFWKFRKLLCAIQTTSYTLIIRSLCLGPINCELKSEQVAGNLCRFLDCLNSNHTVGIGIGIEASLLSSTVFLHRRNDLPSNRAIFK